MASYGRRGATLVREQVLAMKALWTEDEAAFTGEHVTFDDVVDVARSHWRARIPRCSSAPAPGPAAFAAIVEWADGWFPVPFWSHSPADAERLRQASPPTRPRPERAAIIVDGVMPDPRKLEPWHAVGADAARSSRCPPTHSTTCCRARRRGRARRPCPNTADIPRGARHDR